MSGPASLGAWLGLGALCLCLALLAVARLAPGLLSTDRMASRARGPHPAGALEREGTLALDPRRRLILLRVGRRRVLVLTGGGSDVMLAWDEPWPPG